MRLIAFKSSLGPGIALRVGAHEYRGLLSSAAGYPGDLATLLTQGAGALEHARTRLAAAPPLDLAGIEYTAPLANPGKIICIGLNYHDHSAESGFKSPDYPTVFGRFSSSLIGHLQPIVRPRVSEQLDYEGELAVIIGKGGRSIPKESALEHVAGYSLFNDASIRDYQFKSPQWTVGKNFDGTGAFGPEFISADELPPGCKGVRFQTRLNDQVVQQGNIDDLIFDVASLISILSVAFTLSPGDVIVSGTPGGVGLARKPPLWMKPGDICTIASEELGELRNPIVNE
jgi:acylpyruvate hydrolase